MKDTYINEQAKEIQRLTLHVNEMQKTMAEMDNHIEDLDEKLTQADRREMEAYEALQTIAEQTDQEGEDFGCSTCDSVFAETQEIL